VFTFAFPSDYVLLRSFGIMLMRKKPRLRHGPAARLRRPEAYAALSLRDEECVACSGRLVF